MNTEKLTAIAEKCSELLSKYPPCESTAGWRSTIAAIEGLLSYGGTSVIALEALEEIVAAWEAGK